MSERRGELNEETFKVCKDLGCMLLQSEPYPLCQVKSRFDETKEYSIPKVKRQIREDFGSQIPNKCPKKYNDLV